MYFHYFVIISPWRRARPFIWTNLNPLHPRMLCAKFGWNWPSGSGEEDENVKSLRQQWQQQQRQRQQWRQRRTTDKFWSEKLTWAFGSGELKSRTPLWKMGPRWAYTNILRFHLTMDMTKNIKLLSHCFNFYKFCKTSAFKS